ncbi:MAG TPA: biotin/lipoyl-containing protein, partial [Clostridia bacterium]|nr:biotin/lipoyl-containing protein [Clostridia bacterium]
VVDYFKGMLGQPSGGFPKELQDIVLKGETPIVVRPGELLEPEDFDAIAKYLKEKHNMNPDRKSLLSYALYPKTYEGYLDFINEYGDLSRMGSDIFFHGLYEGETCEVEIAEGKALIVKLQEIGKLDNEGNRTVAFEVDGNRREVKIFDKASRPIGTGEQVFTQMADPENKFEIGATIPGVVVKILVKEGEKVDKNQSIILLEAMKMETNITAPVAGIVDNILVRETQQVKVGELLIRLKEE